MISMGAVTRSDGLIWGHYTRLAASICERASRARRGAAAKRGLELRIPRRPRERNHVADVRHPRDELHRPLQAQTEACVRHGSVAPEIKIPPVRFRVEFLLLHALRQYVEP